MRLDSLLRGIALLWVAGALANVPQCPICDSIFSLVDECGFAPLTTTSYSSLEAQGGFKNVTGVPHLLGNYSLEVGPIADAISSLDQSRCFCPSMSTVKQCTACAGKYSYNNPDGTPSLNYNITSSLDIYYHDCNAFGWFLNDTLRTPSTTRTETAAPVHTQWLTCPPCVVIDGQIEKCGLPRLDAPAPPARTASLASDNKFPISLNLLFNRTTAECLCTLPVLRAFDSCFACTHSLASAYFSDCQAFGYWPDSQVVPEDYTVQSTATDSTSTRATATGSASTQTSKTGAAHKIAISSARPSLIVAVIASLGLLWHSDL